MSIGFALLLALYFVLAASAAALLLLPTLREACLQQATVWVRALMRHQRACAQRLYRWRSTPAQALAGWSLTWPSRFQWVLIGSTLMLLAVPVFLAWLLGRNSALPGFAERAEDADPIVASLLIGEALVPPPPLPPEVFTTREVERIRPDLGAASRQWDLLDAEFRQRLLAVYRQLETQGYTAVLLEGYRSPERQALLQSRGSNVTNAGAYQSYHQFGLAADTAFFRDGRLVISERDPWAMRGYQLLGEAAEAQGLRWGGRWQLQDYGHVELKRPGVLGKRP